MSQNLVVPSAVEMQGYTATYPTPDRRHSTAFSRSMSYLPRLNDTVTNPPVLPRNVSPASAHTHFSETATRTFNYPESDLYTKYLDAKVLGHDRIFPFMPERLERYDRRVTVPMKSNDMPIYALTMDYNILYQPDPPGWRRISHREGVRYFFHKENRILTDADLFNERILVQITEDIAVLFDCLRANNIVQLPAYIDLVLDLRFEADGELSPTGYYFANHEKRSIFFLDLVWPSVLPFWINIGGVSCYGHLGQEIEAQYWLHVQLFPTTLEVSEQLLNEIRDILMHSIGDIMTSLTSVSAYSLGELQNFLSLVESCKKNLDANFEGATFTLSRLMFNLARQKFHNFHGQLAARLECGQSVYDNRLKRSPAISLISILLFSSPDVHLRSLNKTFVDGVMNKAIWDKYIEKLRHEWQAITLYATFLLAVNVAFLAIQSVDVNRESYRSAAQIFSYLSAISSIGSIAQSLIIIRNSWENIRVDAMTFLYSRQHYENGLEMLAIRFSLPHALIMWGLLTFITAFWMMCFHNSNLLTLMVVGTFSLILIFVVFWSISMTWELPAASLQIGTWRSRCAKWLSSYQTTSHDQSLFRRVLKWPMLFRRQSSSNSDRATLAGDHC